MSSSVVVATSISVLKLAKAPLLANDFNILRQACREHVKIAIGVSAGILVVCSHDDCRLGGEGEIEVGFILLIEASKKTFASSLCLIKEKRSPGSLW